MNEKNTFWEGAGKAGLILGGVSIAYVAVTGLTGLLEDKVGGSFLFSLFGFILWVAKFGGCIYLMRFFMRSYAFNRTDGTGASPFLFGTTVALLSALLYSAAILVYISFINPGMLTELFDAMRENPMMDSNALALLDGLEARKESFMFFSNLIYCTLFGTIVAAILSGSIPSKNPFEQN